MDACLETVVTIPNVKHLTRQLGYAWIVLQEHLKAGNFFLLDKVPTNMWDVPLLPHTSNLLATHKMFRDSTLGVSGKSDIRAWVPWRVTKYTIGSKVVAYSRVRAVVSLMCPSAHGKSQHPRVSRMLN
jgi:hypothetical protein